MKINPVWTGDVVKEMHIWDIKVQDIACLIGVNPSYVSMALHGARDSEKLRSDIQSALSLLIEQRKEWRKEVNTGHG